MQDIGPTLKGVLRRRPWWMNLLMAFCLYMAVIYVPWDLFAKPVAEDEEVWFGIVLRGWAAKATEPLHWAIYAAGAWGFWNMRPWMHPWAALYVLQIAIAMVMWGALYQSGLRAASGLIPGLLFAGLAWALWRSAPLFRRSAGGAE